MSTWMHVSRRWLALCGVALAVAACGDEQAIEAPPATEDAATSGTDATVSGQDADTQSGTSDVAGGDAEPTTDADPGADTASSDTAADSQSGADADNDAQSNDADNDANSADGALSGCKADADCPASTDPCQVAVCKDGQCTTAAAADGVACDDGNACSEGDTCAAGKCAPGLSKGCDDSNPCTDDSCDLAKGCVNLANAATCSDGSVCTENDTCKDGQCAAGAAKACDDGNPCTDDSCDKEKGCVALPNTATCSDGDACTEGDACASGSCIGGGAVNCDDKNPCTDNSCDKVTGCVATNNTAGCEDGDLCTQNDLCKDGQCGAGAAKSCDDSNACTTDACDPASGTCSNTANTAACDDGSKCTSGDVCKDGSCGGAAVVCDDGNPCTDDSCDAVTGCAVKNNSAACGADDKCLENGVCTGGACKGSAVACDDGNPCTQDLCDSKIGCYFKPIGGVPCDDGDACTSNDLCLSGKCQTGTVKVVCDDANPCTDDSCDKLKGCQVANNTAACEDGNKCTDKDTCAGGKCGAGPATVCDDGNPCTDDGCDAASGCTKKDNTLPCTTGQACEQGVCTAGACVGTGKTSCDDGNPCTKDTCDNASNKCVNTPESDNTVWKAGDACQSDSVCIGGKPTDGAKKVCNDNNPCTDDACSLTLGGCAYSPNAAPCDDGNKCTAGDKCQVVAGQGAKCVAGAAVDPKVVCDDANVCTAESCDAVKGCVNTPAAGPCDDGNKCTVGEACAAGKCSGGSLAGCDDGNSCTADNCDPGTGACSWKQVIGACDDKNPCTTGDTCSGLTCAGTDVSCDDKNPCTADSCDKVSGKCVNAALNSGACDDANPCTSGDTCTAGKCGGAVKKCDDANVCTDDSCDPATGECTAKANTAPCTTADLCVTGSICADTVCKAGTTPKCDDKNPCTVDSCDAKTGTCSYTAGNDGTACDDGIACTKDSVCAQGTCASKAGCNLLTESFTCNTPGSFTVVVPPPDFQWVPARKVVWAVDQLPATPDAQAKGCTLNYNDNNDYCDAFQANNNSYCQLPKGTATSGVLDFSAIGNLTPTLTLDIYYSVDILTGQYLGLDAPKVSWLDSANNAVLGSFVFPVTASDINVWKNGFKIPMPQAKGKKVKIEFSLNLVPAQPQFGTAPYQGNQGVGVFVDNVKADAVYVQETVCGDNIDNDGNGQVDCNDLACKTTVFCAGKTVYSNDIVCGATQNWQFVSTSNTYVWALDQTPATPAAKTGTCTLNYNNGTSYGQQFDQAGRSGTARWNQNVSLANLTSAVLQFWAYQDVEPNGACGNSAGCDNADRLFVQVSSDGFNNCPCNANQSCSMANNQCNTANTQTWLIPKSTLKTWQLWGLDLKAFVGKNVQFRVKFDTIDNAYNNYPGVFLDDVKLLGL